MSFFRGQLSPVKEDQPSRQRPRRGLVGGLLAALVFALSASPGATAGTAPLTDAGAVPQIDASGRSAYGAFLAAHGHKAFAVAPGGTWAWSADKPDRQAAIDAALRSCRQDTAQPCQPYAVDDEVTFDTDRWLRSWHASTAMEAAGAPAGTATGQKFPNLALADPAGRPITLADLQGQVVLLHFWGSWCPYCQRELPELQQLYGEMADTPGVAFVFVQTREPIETSRRWAERAGYALPFYDSGTGPREKLLRLASGESVEDRSLSPQFPTTYVLDRNGVVAFEHAGSASRWPEYAPLIRELLAPPRRQLSLRQE